MSEFMNVEKLAYVRHCQAETKIGLLNAKAGHLTVTIHFAITNLSFLLRH